ncbi:hypothetical protein DWW23_00925 [Parabacteroides sp. AF14-59]|nr:hypothetical protein DWW23_00925 [Parabacteroides sp. AF14-59]
MEMFCHSNGKSLPKTWQSSATTMAVACQAYGKILSPLLPGIIFYIGIKLRWFINSTSYQNVLYLFLFGRRK